MENKLLDDNMGYVSKDSYYNIQGNKNNDILIGVTVGIIYLIFSFLVLSANNFKNLSVFITVIVLIYIVLVSVFFHVHRRYISIALLIVAAVPLVILGGCALLLSNL